VRRHCAGTRAAFADYRQARTDFRSRSLLNQDLGDNTACRRRNLGRNLVGFHVKQHLVRFHRVADFLVPAGDDALDDRLAELRHDDIHQLLLKLISRR